MNAAAAGGTVSFSSMARLFSDLAAELTANRTTLSASQLADLHTIANDLNVGETASAYITYVTDALINGNAANATWTGGSASASPLGNLVAGSTAARVTELDGKWFLGTDRPSSTVQLDGASSFSVSYSAVSNAVFGAGGPGINDINQGNLGDCYLLASLAEVAYQNSSIIQSMIIDNGNNTYGVRFFVNGTAEYVTVDKTLADGGAELNKATNIWASLVEKAYAQIQAGGVITGGGADDGNSFSTIGNGGWPSNALEEITGATAITTFSGNVASWTQSLYNDGLDYQSGTGGVTTASVLSTLVADLGYGCDEVLTSCTNATDSAGRITLVSSHALSIYGYDGTTGDLEVRNPWGTVSGQTWDTTFEVSMGTLLAAGDTITVDNVSHPGNTGNPPAANVTVSAAGATKANAAGTSFTVSDTAANITAALKSLNADANLTSLIVNGTASADTLILSGSKVKATINLDGDTASASSGLSSPQLSFIGNPDKIRLGTGAATIHDTLGTSNGIETIIGFQYGLDQLAIDMKGAANSVLKASDTTVSGVHAISIYGGTSTSDGVVLLDLSPTLTAANLLSSHTTFSGGQATIT